MQNSEQFKPSVCIKGCYKEAYDKKSNCGTLVLAKL